MIRNRHGFTPKVYPNNQCSTVVIEGKMEVLSCLLWFLLTWVLVTALQAIARGGGATSTKLPPGPTQFPVIGNLLELGDKPHKSLAKLAKVHGPIMSLKLGQVTTIVISSANLAKEVLQLHDILFCDRTVRDVIHAQKHHEFSVIWLPASAAWRNFRRICNSHIFTSQKLDSTKDLRRKEVQHLLAYVEESCRAGTALDIGQVAFNTNMNMMSNTLFSVDLADPRSDTARQFKELVWDIMSGIGKTNLADYFPVLKKIDPQGRRRRMAVHFRNLFDLFDRMIDQRLKLREANGSVDNRDMLDTLLNIVENSSEEINRDSIKHLFMDLFNAGTDTTSNTLEWAMAELLKYPEVLSKVRLELEQTVGRGNQVEESDINRLPYLQAVVKEILRLHPVAPLLLPHKASSDIEIGGFTVPKGAQVLVNSWAIARDATTWENPNTFLPERFLGSDLDVKGRNFELIPFGAGRRMCPGLPLAMRMLHLMLGSLINSFDWKLQDGVTPENMDMDDKFGVTLQKAQPLLAVPIAI